MITKKSNVTIISKRIPKCSQNVFFVPIIILSIIYYLYHFYILFSFTLIFFLFDIYSYIYVLISTPFSIMEEVVSLLVVVIPATITFKLIT